MSSIKIRTPDISENIRTFLTQDYTSGTSVSVVSSTSFVSSMYVVVGEPNTENAELINLSATPPDNTTLTIGSLKFSHPAGTPITYVDFDKFELSYRVDSSSAWVIYGSMPASLAFDALFTEYRDSAATSTYEWRYRYYSTQKTAYSDYSDTIGTTGWAKNAVGYMVRNVRKIINDPESKTIQDIEIIRFFNAGQDVIYSLYDRWWFLLTTGTTIPTVADQIPYALPDDFGRLHTVQFNYVSGSNDVIYSLRSQTMQEFDYLVRDNNAAHDDNVKFYCIYPGDSTNQSGYIHVYPKPETAGLSIIPRYYKLFTDLTSYGDETEVPIPDLLENYAISKILEIRGETDKAAVYDKMFKNQVQLLKLLQRKDAKPMRSLWKYKGSNAEKRLFGTRDLTVDITKEQYW